MTPESLPLLDLSAPDPRAAAAAARQIAPIARNERGFHVLTYEGCEQGFLDAVFLHGGRAMMALAGVAGEAAMEPGGRTLTGTEGDEHAALRQAIQPWFTPGTVARLRERTRELITRAITSTGADVEFMGDVARDIPGVVFSWMLGAPASDGPLFTRLSEALLRTFRGDPADAPIILSAAVELRAYVDDLITQRQREPGEDLVSALVAELDRGTITLDDVHTLLGESLAASTDNTFNSAGIVMYLLADRAELWREVRLDPSLVPTVVEECLRFEPWVRTMPTVTAEAVTLCGVDLPATALVNLDLAAAHRDPAAFNRPDVLDIHRGSSKRQLNFGLGRHHCLGAALARMELHVILEETTKAWSEVSPAGDPELALETEGAVHRLPIAVV